MPRPGSLPRSVACDPPPGMGPEPCEAAGAPRAEATSGRCCPSGGGLLGSLAAWLLRGALRAPAEGSGGGRGTATVLQNLKRG